MLIITVALAQQGWRNGEMEVKVSLKTVADREILRKCRFETEEGSPDGSVIRAYLVPEELKILKSTGLEYKIVIPDLNGHYQNYWTNKAVPPGYYTYEEIVAIADSLATAFPSICKKVLYGQTPYYRELAALKISDNVEVDEDEPEILFDGGIHGDEVGGSQNMIMYARDLCLGYGTDTALTSLINNREIWIYYMVNPDGRFSMTRYNAYGIDINRDAGYMWNGEGNSPGPFSQKESKALRQCLFDNQFVVYTNYHSGTEVIAYPWSYRGNATPDVVHINNLAHIYSETSGYANLLYGQGYNIMYAINGSYKDVQYGSLGNVGWSIEISADKEPPYTQIMTYYNKNKPAMTEMINRAGYGVEGIVTDSISGLTIAATVWVNDYYPVRTDPAVGDYHKYLLPGSYTIRVTASGHKSMTISNVTVPATGSVVTDFQLAPDSGFYAYRVINCQIPDNNYGDEGYTPGSAGAPDSISYSIGKNGYITLDMGDTIHDAPGDDIRVYEAGAPDEGFYCYASTTMDGPWIMLGMGTGTTSFDLAAGSVAQARYIRIKDDNDGVPYGQDIGFDLDAVQMLNLPMSPGFVADDTLITEGGVVNFTDLSEGKPSIWKWKFPGGVPSESSEKNPAGIVYPTEGIYNVSLTISNGLSVMSQVKTQYIQVSKPNAIASNHAQQSLAVTPNPTDGVTRLEIRNCKGGSYIAFNDLGRPVSRDVIRDNVQTAVLDLTGNPPGVYFLQVTSPGGNITKKIVVF